MDHLEDHFSPQVRLLGLNILFVLDFLLMLAALIFMVHLGMRFLVTPDLTRGLLVVCLIAVFIISARLAYTLERAIRRLELES